jgi:hypothetical protein
MAVAVVGRCSPEGSAYKNAASDHEGCLGMDVAGLAPKGIRECFTLSLRANCSEGARTQSTPDGLRAVMVFDHRPVALSHIQFFDWERLADHRR